MRAVLLTCLFTGTVAINLKSTSLLVTTYKHGKMQLKMKTPAQLRAAWVLTVKSTGSNVVVLNTGANTQLSKMFGATTSNTAGEAQAMHNLFCATFGGFSGTGLCSQWGFVGGACASTTRATVANCGAQASGYGDDFADEAYVQRGNLGLTAATGAHFTQQAWESFGSSSAAGDPHVTNMQGQRFDILKSGPRVLVKYPREAAEESLVVVAHVVRADSRWCENTFIEEVTARGSMLGTSARFTIGKLRSPRPFRVMLGTQSLSLHDVIKEKVLLKTAGSYLAAEGTTMILKLNEVYVRVQVVKHTHFQFLNLDVSGLSNLDGDVGGLLGMDDHAEEAHDNCKWKTHKPKLLLEQEDTDLGSLITAA